MININFVWKEKNTLFDIRRTEYFQSVLSSILLRFSQVAYSDFSMNRLEAEIWQNKFLLDDLNENADESNENHFSAIVDRLAETVIYERYFISKNG